MKNINTFINKTVKDIFLKQGLVQKGNSRIWLNDLGWCILFIEFTPSSFSKGSGLNVGICFLWTVKDDLSYDINLLSKKFQPYQDKKQFSHIIKQYSQEALKMIARYKKLYSSYPTAEKDIINHQFTDEYYHGNLHKAYISLLNHHPEKGLKYLNSILKGQPEIKWQKEIFQEAKKIKVNIKNEEKTIKNIEKQISQTRQLLNLD